MVARLAIAINIVIIWNFQGYKRWSNLLEELTKRRAENKKTKPVQSSLIFVIRDQFYFGHCILVGIGLHFGEPFLPLYVWVPRVQFCILK